MIVQVIFLLLPNILGALSGASASKNVDSWYRSLKKPRYNCFSRHCRVEGLLLKIKVAVGHF